MIIVVIEIVIAVCCLGVRTEEDKRHQRGPVKGCTTNEWHCTKAYYQCLLCSLSLSFLVFTHSWLFYLHLSHTSFSSISNTRCNIYLFSLFVCYVSYLFLLQPLHTFYTLFHAFRFLEVVVFFFFVQKHQIRRIYMHFFCTLYKEFNSLVLLASCFLVMVYKLQSLRSNLSTL